MGKAAPGATLVRVVPRGHSISPYSGYWLSPEQARAIATMTPEQAGRVFGLPAAQSANMMIKGVVYYAITLKAGVASNVFVIPFVNQVAPYGTTQGILLFGVGSKGVTVIDDIRHSGEKK